MPYLIMNGENQPLRHRYERMLSSAIDRRYIAQSVFNPKATNSNSIQSTRLLLCQLNTYNLSHAVGSAVALDKGFEWNPLHLNAVVGEALLKAL